MNEAVQHSADLAPPERLHPLILLTGIGGSLRGMAGGYAALGYLAATGSLRTAFYGAVGLLLVMAVGLFLYWRRFEYRVGAHEIRIDSGIVSRTHRSIPFDRVQDVDITQGPLARLLGIARVKLETGAGSAGGAEEGVLPAIALARAEALREHVRTRRGGAALSDPQDDGAERPPIFAMNLGRVLTAGVFNFSLAIFAGLFGATQTFGDVLGFDPLERAFWDRVLAGNPLLDYAAEHRVAAALAGLAVLGLAGLLTGLVRTLLRDFGFRIDRTGTGLRRRRGLLTRTDVTLPLRRVQAVLILTGPVRQAFGWRELKLQSLAQDEGGKGDHVIAPLARPEELDPLFEALCWAPPSVDADWQPVERAYVWTFLIAWSPLLLLAALQAAVLLGAVSLVDEVTQGPVLAAFAPVLIASAVLSGGVLVATATRWMCWRRTAFAFDGKRLLIRTGWWRRRLLVLPFASVQSVDLSESALGRRFGVANVVIGVAGGSGFSGHRVPALTREKASQLRRTLLSQLA